MAQVILRPNTYKVGLCDPGVRYVLFKDSGWYKYEHELNMDSSGNYGLTYVNDYQAYGFNISPQRIFSDKKIVKISNDQNTGFALDEHRDLWTSGFGDYGERGDNDNTRYKITPVKVYGNHSFNKISYCSGLDINGKAWKWGRNVTGVIGDNTTTNRSTPVAVCGNHTFCEISTVWYDYTIALDQNGKAWAWGYNAHGYLGTNNTTSYSTPVAVCGNHTFCQITALADFNIALDNNGKAWTWGLNNFGQLGNNSTVNTSTPVAVYGNHTFCRIVEQMSVGYKNGAIDIHGQLWCWGVGYLGNNTNTSVSTPVAVCGNHTFKKVVLIEAETLALDNNNKLWAWGENTNGRLGVGDQIDHLTPVSVYSNYS